MNGAMQAAFSRDLNWNQLWLEARRRGDDVESNRTRWNSRASSFASHTRQSGYAAHFIRYLQADPAWTILDVGCGPGTLAIPLASQVRSITAIDISERMIGILDETCREQHIANIEGRVIAWEDDWHRAGLKRHDVAIASRSLAMDNLEMAITKLAAMARKKVVISSLVGDGPYDRKIFAAIGRDLDRGPDFICVYNLLNQMSIHADVTFLPSANQQPAFANLEEATHGFDWMIRDMTGDERLRLRRYLARHLVRCGDGWSLNYRHVAKWAVMSWNI